MRVLGIDTGVHTGVAVLDVGARQATFVTAATWQSRDLERYALDLLFGPRGLAMAFRPDMIAIEHIERVHGSKRMGSKYADGLVGANELAGLLRGIALARGVRVERCTAGRWRAALCGSKCASDAAIAQMVKVRVVGWPKVSNEHQRDAAGVALFAGLAPRATRAA